MIEAANPSTPPAIAARNDQIIRRALQRARCFLCGHDDRVIFADRRIYVKCDTCDRERDGIALDRPAPRRRVS